MRPATPVFRALRGACGELFFARLEKLERRPDKVFTDGAGWLVFEEEYIPRVVTRENGNAAPEALKAQAVAARTYVLRAMRDDGALGTTSKPLPNSERFQTFAASATDACREASRATRGEVLRFGGQLLLANYVAGALWTAEGGKGKDATNTERFVTYNDGLTGADVKPTTLASTKRPDNRGCMSQNGADWLARHARDYGAILRFFYGADAELDGASDVSPSSSEPTSPPADGTSSSSTEASSSSSSPLFVAGAAALAAFVWGGGS